MKELIEAIIMTEGHQLKHAQQFFVDSIPWPEGVYGYKNKIFLDTPDGTVEIQDGDWIAQTTENKNYYIRIQNEKVE